MRRMLIGMIVAGGLCGAAQARYLQPSELDQTSEVEQARADFESMRREIMRMDRDIDRAENKALEEARNGGGQADPATVAELLSLRDQRDRVYNRMLILSTRHGFEMPDMSGKAAEERKSRPLTSPFEPMQAQLREQIKAEALILATSVDVPVFSLDPAIRAAGK